MFYYVLLYQKGCKWRLLKESLNKKESWVQLSNKVYIERVRLISTFGLNKDLETSKSPKQ